MKKIIILLVLGLSFAICFGEVTERIKGELVDTLVAGDHINVILNVFKGPPTPIRLKDVNGHMTLGFTADSIAGYAQDVIYYDSVNVSFCSAMIFDYGNLELPGDTLWGDTIMVLVDDSVKIGKPTKEDFSKLIYVNDLLTEANPHKGYIPGCIYVLDIWRTVCDEDTTALGEEVRIRWRTGWVVEGY